MEILLQLLLGVALAVLFILFAGTRKPRRERVVYSVGLIVASLVYAAFAVSGASVRQLMNEAVGVAVFTLVAVLGLRASAWWLVFGWAAHVLWDVGIHLILPQGFVPGWYPVACISFDLTVAAVLAFRLRKDHI